MARASRLVLAAATSLLVSSVAGAVDPIIIKGSKFFYKNSGAQFFIKGLAYGQDSTGIVAVSNSSSDPLTDAAACQRDVPLMKELSTNVVRVYDIDPTGDHDSCMQLLADNGIYVLADLSSGGTNGAINRYDPEWTDDIYASYAARVDVMQQYENTLGFFAGNEVAYAPNSSASAPFVKAAVRDMKAYIKQKGYRDIGVGYATDDNPGVRFILADYFNCGDQTDAIDFWGYNIYSWCGDSSYVTSGYEQRTAEFSNYSIPVFFAEYGCHDPPDRTFTEVAALYGDKMSPVFSGGIVYEYFEQSNDYGLVTIGSNNKATKLPDFANLQTQISAISPASTSYSDYTPSNVPQDCPSSQNDFRAQPTPLPPTPNEELCSCMYEALSCIVNPDTSTNAYAADFNYVCAQEPKACVGFAHKAATGTYGAYSMCNATQQLGWAFNTYYELQKRASTACDFKGHAKLQKSTTNSKCKALIEEAGALGTATVTATPSGTGAGAAASGSSGSGSSGSGASSSKGAAASLNHPWPSENYLLQTVCVLALAAISGCAAVLL